MMRNLLKNTLTTLLFSTSALLCGFGATAQGATFVNSGHAAGPQCGTASVNDAGQVVGNCVSGAADAYGKPWFSTTLAGPQQVLQPLAADQPCSVSAIANNGWIVGNCGNAANLSFASIWSAATPSIIAKALAPLPARVLIILPFRAADVQTLLVAQNQNGVVLAQSISSGSDDTVVMYPAGSTTPQRVSDWGDNCVGVDLTEALTNGMPRILMNCPGPNGTRLVTVATWSGGGYSLAIAPIPTGASYCLAADMNDQGQFVGTCLYPASVGTGVQSAFWNSASTAPLTLVLPMGAQNTAVAINDQGHVLAYGKDASTHIGEGVRIPFFWPDPTSSFSVRPIQPLPDSKTIRAVGLGNDDTVAMNCEDTSKYVTGCYWTPSGGIAVALPPIPGGVKSELAGISPAGGIVFGAATDSDSTVNAVGATLP